MALTPGHTSDAGVRYRTFDPDAAILRCFQCHSTGPLRIEAGAAIQPFEPGVRCETCHGPGEAHAKSKGTIRNPKRMNGAEVNEFCGACHRKVSGGAEEFTDWSDAWNVRHQPLYLAQSRCFLKSAGKLSCFTCHAPHESAVKPACKSCHADVRHKSAIANQTCTSCHMPAVKLNDNLQFANHWIGVFRRGEVLRPDRSGLPPTSRD